MKTNTVTPKGREVQISTIGGDGYFVNDPETVVFFEGGHSCSLQTYACDVDAWAGHDKWVRNLDVIDEAIDERMAPTDDCGVEVPCDDCTDISCPSHPSNCEEVKE